MKTTNQVSRIAGVSRRTIQYYDDIGLLGAKRGENNYRLYGDEELKRLWEILLYKEMGFRLDEIGRIFKMDEEEKISFLRTHKAEIGEKILGLMKREELISAILAKGFPPMPEDNEGGSFADKAREISRQGNPTGRPLRDN